MKLFFVTLVVQALIVQGISLRFFGGKCTIKNKFHDEYLYAAEVENDGSRREVFTWIDDKEVDLDGYFFIESDYSHTFTIKNKKHDEYLYTFYIPSGNGNRRVYTWIPLPRDKFPECSWKIEPLDSRNTYTISNFVFNEFLCASVEKYDPSRRLVHTRPTTDSSCSWIITCDSKESKLHGLTV